MIEFDDVIDRIKDILSREIDGKVFDKDVARALGVHNVTFSSMKRRGSVPYEQILVFCAERKIQANWVFFGQPTAVLKDFWVA